MIKIALKKSHISWETSHMKGRYSRFNKHLTTVIAAIVILMISFTAFAAEEETDYDPTLNPELVQPAFLNQIINVSNTGAAAFSVPIQVPPGRGGIAVPGLSLQYASSGSNGWVGIGWDLSMGAIQRRTKYGLDYSGTDFVVNGATELVAQPDWGTNYYGARLEESFTRYQFVSADRRLGRHSKRRHQILLWPKREFPAE